MMCVMRKEALICSQNGKVITLLNYCNGPGQQTMGALKVNKKMYDKRGNCVAAKAIFLPYVFHDFVKML